MAQEQTIPVVDLRDYTEGDESTRKDFVANIGDALKDLGFVAVDGGHVLLPEHRDVIWAFFARWAARPAR